MGRRRAVIVAYSLVFVGAGVWLPYFSLWLQQLGFAGWQIGVVMGMQPALRWGSAIGWAYAADRWRIRRRLHVATALAGGLFFVPLVFAREFGTVVGLLTVIGILHGSVIPLLDATVMDHLPRLGGDYGRLRLWGSVAFVAGAFGSAPVIHAFSPAIVPMCILVPALLLAPALWGLPAEQLGHPERFRAPWRLLTPPLTAFLATAFLVQLSSGAWAGFFAVHTAALGLSDTVPGVTWGVAAISEVVMLFAGRRLLARIAPADLILVSLAGTVVRWALTAVAKSAPLVVALQLGHALTFAAFHLAALLLLARLVPAESSTGGQALYGVVTFGIAGSAGLNLAGALIDRLGTARLFGFEAIVASLGFLPALYLRRLAAQERAPRWGAYRNPD